MKQEDNPLKKLWNILGTIGGIIGLSSMVERWVDDLLKWKGIIDKLIISYRELTTPFFDIILGWVPFSVPLWFHDYLFLGLILFTSEYRSNESNRYETCEVKISNKMATFALGIGKLVLWPFDLFSKFRSYKNLRMHIAAGRDQIQIGLHPNPKIFMHSS